MKNINIRVFPVVKRFFNDVDFNRFSFMNYGEDLTVFCSKIMNSFSDDDLTLFYNNINRVFVNDKPCDCDGKYYPRKNSIFINDECDDCTVIFHELFHMASSCFKNGISYSGFHQSKSYFDKFSFGVGINEVYTELLTDRYFAKDYNIDNSNNFRVLIGKACEDIIGKEKMESLYLNADLYNLACEFSKYSLYDDVLYFIYSLDFFNNNSKNGWDGLTITLLDFISNFLVYSYLDKLKLDLINGSASLDDCVLLFNKFLSDYSVTFNFDDFYYEFIKSSDRMDIICLARKELYSAYNERFAKCL